MDAEEVKYREKLAAEMAALEVVLKGLIGKTVSYRLYIEDRYCTPGQPNYRMETDTLMSVGKGMATVMDPWIVEQMKKPDSGYAVATHGKKVSIYDIVC